MTHGVVQVQARIAAIQSQLVALAPAPPRAREATGVPDASFRAALAEAEQTFLPTATTATGTAAGPEAERLLDAARRHLGVPYLWGGTDPATGLDCSGFVQLAFRDVGIELPRVSADQARQGQPVASMADARPGDLLAFDYSAARPGIDHIAIYVGDGKMIHAPRRGDVVKIEDVPRAPDAIRRVLPEGATGAAAAFGVGGGGVPAGTPYAELFQSAGARHGVSPALLTAVARAESGFDPRAVSHAGAQGLMQLMPGTARGLGVTDSFDPIQAVDGAARLLSDHLDRFGSVELALAAYNAGPGAVQRYGGVPPFRETQAYVAKIMRELA